MRLLFMAVLLLSLSIPLAGQTAGNPSQYMKYGEVRHLDGSAVVVANDHHPLRQAIEALREEYGWVVDYEDPRFHSDLDFIETTEPAWRASHPNQRGWWLLAGGAFRTEFAEPPNAATSLAEEEKILSKVVADYNHSENPGKYRVVKREGGRLAVIGEYVKDDTGREEYSAPILDTPISLATATRSGPQAVSDILEELSKTAGIKVAWIFWGNPPLMGSTVTLGGENVRARDFLLKVLNSKGRPLMLELVFTPVFNEYDLVIQVASLTKLDRDGNRRTEAIDALPPRKAPLGPSKP